MEHKDRFTMEQKDFKFDAHKGFEAYWAQAMMYQILLSDHFEPETYICSPLRADTVKGVEMNISAVRAYMCYSIMKMGQNVTAPHAFLPMVLDDEVPEEREVALQFGLVILKKCKRMFVCGRQLSSGMLGEINRAFVLGKEIRVFNRGLYGAVKEIAEKNGYNLDLLVYDNTHRYLSLSAQEIIPHEDDGEGDEDAM